MYTGLTLILIHLLPTLQWVASQPHPPHNQDPTSLAWEFTPHDISTISSLRSPLESRALTFPLGTIDWDFILDDLFTLIQVSDSTRNLISLYSHIQNIDTVECIHHDPLPVIIFASGGCRWR